jgi:hypothetical protein
MGTEDLSIIVGRVLGAAMTRFNADQIFLFAPDGDPFWVARTPITSEELEVFKAALDLLARLECTMDKPFATHAPDGSYSVAALASDSDLFLILIDRKPTAAAVSRVARVRDEVLPAVEHLRTEVLRAAAMAH